MAMRGNVFLSVLFVLGATGVLHADDAVDAKLNELKKKKPQRVYSVAAVLSDQNLIVPKETSDEEKALDEKIRAMERELDAKPVVVSRQVARSRPVARPEEDSPANWLTPALLDQSSRKNGALDEEETSWVTAELARQEGIRQEKLSQEEEMKLVEQRVEDEMRRNTTTSFAPADDYNDSLQNIISGGSPAAKALEESSRDQRLPFYRPQGFSPASNIQKTPENSSSLFPFPRSQSSATAPKRSSSFSQSQGLDLDFNSRPASTVSRQPPDVEDPEPIRTRMRPAAPFREKNPFEKEWVPSMQKSIWD